MKQFLLLLMLAGVMGCSVNKTMQESHRFTGKTVGCGNFTVYRLTEDNQSYISVNLKVAQLELNEKQVYAIGKADVVDVRHKAFSGPINNAICNDVMGDRPDQQTNEMAKSGQVEVLFSKEELTKARNNEPYRVTVVLKDVVFGGVTISYLRYENTYVGWLPG